jgi:hypothetical protein
VRLNTNVLGSLFWIAVGVVFFLGGIGANVGTFRRPGPGFLPAIMAGAVICLGFPFSTFVLMFILFGVLFEGNNRWAKSVIYAAITAFAAWLVFSVGCQVPFPTPLIFGG